MEKYAKKLQDIINEQDFCFEPEEIKTVEKALGVLRMYEDANIPAEACAEKLVELERICRELNGAYGRYASLKTRYDEIMAYWKQQKRRGYITPEEYQQLAEEFIGARPVKNKEDETNGKDP